MKKILLLCFILTICTAALPAQEFRIGVGPYAAFKMGINGVEAPWGRKNAIAFNNVPDLGLTLDFSFAEDSYVGARLDIGYTGYSYTIEDFDKSKNYDFILQYFTIGPSIDIDGFLFGFNLLLPLSGKFGPEIDSKTLKMLAEFRMGYNYPIFMDETGSLKTFIFVSYMLSGVYNDFPKNDPLIDIIPPSGTQVFTDEFNPRVASVAIGFSYNFNMWF